MNRDYKKYNTHRRSRRLPGHDYASPAAYFVTICTRDRMCLFGEIEDGQMHLNAWGRVAAEEWTRTETLRDEVHLDAFIIMPNHMHGIIVIAPPDADAPTDPRGYDMVPIAHDEPAGNDPAPGSDMARHVATSSSKRQFGQPKAGALGTIIGAYKSAATRRINRRRGTPGAPVWQRNYHDRVIRDEDEWRRIRRYIATNPARWYIDTHYSIR